MALLAVDRQPEVGEAWAVTYNEREEVSLGTGWVLPVVAQPDDSEPYPNAYEGEVVLDHPIHGYIIVQSIDCTYQEQENN